MTSRQPTLSTKFSILSTPQVNLRENEMMWHGSVPRQANYLAVEEASVPELTRRAKWSNEEEIKARQGRPGIPRRALLTVYRGHTSAVTSACCFVLGEQEFLFTGSSDCTIRMINVETSRTIRVFEGHQGAVSSLAVHTVFGSECQVAESRHLIQTLCPVWNEPDEDVFEFELTSTKKIISVRAFDWNRMGQHDLIGNFELGLEEDILVGKAVENPVITCWYPLHYKGISRGRGKLKLEFRWSNRYMKLTVKLVAGKELPRMDRFGLCDPFVKIKITDKPVLHLFSGSFDTKAHMWDIKTVCSRVQSN